MSGVQQNMGVHTCAVGMTLTAAQYYEIKDGLGDFLRKSDGNYWSRSEHYTVDAFREQGVGLYLSRMDTIYRCEGAELSRAGYLPAETQRHYFKQTKTVPRNGKASGFTAAAVWLAAFNRPDENQSDGFDMRFDLSGVGSGAAAYSHFAEIVSLTPLQAGLFSGRGRKSEKRKRGE